MESVIKTLSYEECQKDLAQGVNCLDYFRKLILNDLPQSIIHNVWIAGGAVKDWFLNGKVEKDLDLFSTDRKSMALLARHLRAEYQFKAFLITKNAIKGFCFIKGVRYDLDIVKKEFQNQTDCVDKFDFTVTCFAASAEKFTYHTSAPFDLLRNRIVIHSLPHPVDSLKRLQKYIKKGFTACNGTILTIGKAIAQQNPEDESVFEFYKFD